MGVQIRKLYEPHFYPGAPVHPIFQKLFNVGEEEGQGFVRTNVCTFGFEPNPLWTSTLQAIESEYIKRGFPVVIFTETAVHSHGRNISFFMEPAEDVKNREWGASLGEWHDNMTQGDISTLMYSRAHFSTPTLHTQSILLLHIISLFNSIPCLLPSNLVTVGALPFHQFIQWVIANRKGASFDSRMAAKMDIEGAEYILLPNLMLTGVLCLFDIFMAEFHPHSVDSEVPPDEHSFVASIEWILKHTVNCKVYFVVGGDETYAFSTVPVSTCIIPHNVYASTFTDDILTNFSQYYLATVRTLGVSTHLTYVNNITFPAYALPTKAQLLSVKMVDIFQFGLTQLNDRIQTLGQSPSITLLSPSYNVIVSPILSTPFYLLH